MPHRFTKAILLCTIGLHAWRGVQVARAEQALDPQEIPQPDEPAERDNNSLRRPTYRLALNKQFDRGMSTDTIALRRHATITEQLDLSYVEADPKLVEKITTRQLKSKATKSPTVPNTKATKAPEIIKATPHTKS